MNDIDRHFIGSRRRRLLPDAAYHFWAVDGADNELGPPRETMAEAQADARRMRVNLDPWNHPRVYVEWAVSEWRVRALLAARAVTR